MKPQQIQRYEATEYMSASLARLIEIADILKVQVSHRFRPRVHLSKVRLFAWSSANDVDWSRFR